jgi:hypothetical protein
MTAAVRPDHADRWEEITGTRWTLTDGVSTVINMKEGVVRHKQPVWQMVNRNTLEFWDPPTATLHDIKWQRRGKPRATLHRWDMRSAYLNAAAQVTLPYGTPKPDHLGFGVGYYRVRLTRPQAAEIYLPPPDRQGCLWATHELETAIGSIAHEVVDRWSDPAPGGRILRSWAEKWRDIILANPDMGPHLKRGYAEAIGLMGAKSPGIYRPDWRHMIIDYVRASMIRRVRNVQRELGFTPYKIDVDSVWYELPWPTILPANDQAYIGAALGVGGRIGQMRYEGVSP